MDIVNGSTGDPCSYCRFKLFQRMPTAQDILDIIVFALLDRIAYYCRMMRRLNTKMQASLSIKLAQYPWLCPPVSLLFNGLAHWAEYLVRCYTGLCSRSRPQFTRGFNCTNQLTLDAHRASLHRTPLLSVRPQCLQKLFRHCELRFHHLSSVGLFLLSSDITTLPDSERITTKLSSLHFTPLPF